MAEIVCLPPWVLLPNSGTTLPGANVIFISKSGEPEMDEKSWYDYFLDILLPTPETEEHSTATCTCDKDGTVCSECITNALEDSLGG